MTTRERLRHRERRGVSLVEIMAAMTVLTVVLGLTVALLEMLLRLNTAGGEHAAHEATIARLGRAFRRDVRDADLVSRCDEGGTSGTLTLGHSGRAPIVEYQIRKAEVVRVEWDGDEIVKQERYALPLNSAPRFERPVPKDRHVLALVVNRRARKTETGVVHPMRIEASLGAARRFEIQTAERGAAR